MTEIDQGQNVTVFNHVKRHWEPGQVVSKHTSPRSYNVQTQSGEILRRNRLDLRESHNDFNVQTDYSDINLSKSMLVNKRLSDSASPYVLPGQNVCETDTTLNSNLKSSFESTCHTKTRSGRIVKPVERLNL